MQKPIVATIRSDDGSADTERLQELAELLSDDELSVVTLDEVEALGDAEEN